MPKVPHTNPKALAIDFFCGAGGSTRGFIDAGMLVLAGIDCDANCSMTYQHLGNNSNPTDEMLPKFIAKDIAQDRLEIVSTLKDELSRAQQKYSNLPLIFAICAPCQPFTRLMKTKLAYETAKRRRSDSNLLLTALDYISEFSPNAVFSENVPGIASEEKYGDIYAQFKRAITIGYGTYAYDIVDGIVNAKYFGVPQNRRRNILLAIRRSRAVPARNLGHLPDCDNALGGRLITVAEALGTENKPRFPLLRAGTASLSDPNHRASALSPDNLRRIKLARPGGNNFLLGDLRVPSHKKADRNGNLDHHSDVYGRMDPNKVAPTITTKCYSFSNGRYGSPFKDQNRAISLREAAVLQSFPMNYKFFPQDKIVTVGKQIGNAVPPKLAEFFGRYVLELLT